MKCKTELPYNTTVVSQNPNSRDAILADRLEVMKIDPSSDASICAVSRIKMRRIGNIIIQISSSLKRYYRFIL